MLIYSPGRDEDTSDTRQSASCGDLPNQCPPHSSEISASLSFPLPLTETVTLNRRHGSFHCDSAKTFLTRREKIKEARPQRPITTGSLTLVCKLDPVIPAPKRAT